jgi:hypothetical protein
MSDFGIPGYEPRWLSGLTALSRAHGDRLASLRGRTLRHCWIVWDHAADSWFADCPILLDFDGEQVEINHHNLDALSLTWNTADPTMLVRWPIEDLFDLGWRRDAHPELTALHGQRLDAVELLEWTGTDLARGMVAVSFAFTAHRLTIYNALDENGLAFGPPDPRYARTHLPAA